MAACAMDLPVVFPGWTIGDKDAFSKEVSKHFVNHVALDVLVEPTRVKGRGLGRLTRPSAHAAGSPVYSRTDLERTAPLLVLGQRQKHSPLADR